MIKRTLSLAVVAGLVGAGLIFGGTAVLSRIGPVSAAQLPALIVEGSGGASGSASLPVDSKNLDPSQDGKTAMAVGSNTPSALPRVSDSFSAADQMPPPGSPGPFATLARVAEPVRAGGTGGAGPEQPTSNAAMESAPAVKVTIAELLANPSSYLGRVVSSAGRVTSLSSDRFLINDGTGQIMVDLEDNLVKVAITNGSIVTVVGEFGQIGNGSVFDINARAVTNRGGATAAGKPSGVGPARPGPTTGCDDDRDGDFDDDCGPDDKVGPTPPPHGDDDNGDDDNGDDDNGDDDNGDDDNGDDDSGDDDDGEDD
jgi:uncharacterized protein YdeI (BOF family)